MIAARPRRARAALSWEDTHDARFVRAVYGKDVQPGIQGDFTVPSTCPASQRLLALAVQERLAVGRMQRWPLN